MRTLCVAAILAALSLSAHSGDLTPTDLQAMLHKGGAVSMMQSLDADSWDSFLGHVRAGDRGWIDMVPDLLPGVDNSARPGLVAALSGALGTNPAGVLTLLSHNSFAVPDICGGSQNEAPLTAARSIDAALVKVASVLDSSLSEARNACIVALGKARIAALL